MRLSRSTPIRIGRFPAVIHDLRFASETIQGVVTYKAILDIDNSELLLRPGMTATAEIKVTELQDALLIPNAGLRYTPATTDTAAKRSFLSRLLPGPPPFRAAKPQEQTGINRTVYVLRNAEPAVATAIKIGRKTLVATQARRRRAANGRQSDH